MKILSSIALIFLVVVGLISCRADGDVTVIKLGHALSVSHPVHDAMEFLAQRLDEKSGGKMQIRIYPNQQLGSERELLELLQIGSLGMTKVSSAVLEGFSPKMQVFSQPYLFKDDAHRKAVLNGSIGKELLLEGEKFWLRGLCYYDAGKRSFYSKTKAIQSPEDLRGLKIRVMESNTAITMVKSFGGSPTPVSYGELYSALQQGIVDGAENNPPSFFTSRHYEVCKFYTINEHTAIPDIIVVSTKIWDRLSDQEKIWLQEAADESVDYQYRVWAEAEEKSLTELEKAGVEIIRPDVNSFRALVEPMYQQLKQNQPEIYQVIEKIRSHE